jgi:hypothetical protein
MQVCHCIDNTEKFMFSGKRHGSHRLMEFGSTSEQIQAFEILVNVKLNTCCLDNLLSLYVVFLLFLVCPASECLPIVK